ncbi:OPT superfamily oligopeptide transporter [Neoconidiobolus thromboides FSU 785]|nr:OPT superfamily oligopeptide transporter [Neoconidiobolus thromboides FSU 785]
MTQKPSSIINHPSNNDKYYIDLPITSHDHYEDHEDDDIPTEFTWRASILGSLLGCIIATSNMYLGMKAGWSFSASIFGSILGYAILKPISKLPPYLLGGAFGIKENCTIQTAATTAGGLFAGYVGGIPALFRMKLLPPVQECWELLFMWTIAAGFYGLFFAVPLRKLFIIQRKLVFPSPTAAALTIRSLHAKDGIEAKVKTKWILGSFVFSIIYKTVGYFIPFLLDMHLFYWLSIPTNSTILQLIDPFWKWHLQITTAFFGAGMMVGLNTSISFFIGDVLAWGIIGPILFYTTSDVNITKPWGYKKEGATVQSWCVWVGIVIMLSSSFTELFMDYKTILGAIKSMLIQFNNLLAYLFPIKKRAFYGQDNLDPVKDEDQIPLWMWLSGTLASLLLTVLVLRFYFNMFIGAGILAALLGFIFSFIGCQAAGETDINPTGVIGKASQFCFAKINAIDIQTKQTNNIIAGVLAAACSQQTVDMVGDLKTGHLLHVSPKSQFYAQLVGSVFGVIIAVVLFMLFATAYPCILDINNSSDNCPYTVPGAAGWVGVTLALTTDFLKTVPESCQIACLIFGLSTILFTILKKSYLKKYKNYLPNWNAIGIAFVSPTPYIPLAFLIGALIALVWAKINPKYWNLMGVALASGLIAGEGIGGLFHAIFSISGLEQSKVAWTFACPKGQC